MAWSPRRALEWFVAPARGFEDGAPVRVGVAVVVVLCVVNAALASQAAGAVADATVGSTEVDNPARPDDWICERASEDELYASYQEACETEPETVTREYATVAGNAAGGLVPVTFLAPLAACLAVAGAFAVAMGGRSHDDPGDRVSYAAVFGVTGVGFAPAALRYAARTLAVERAVSEDALAPASLEEARSLAVEAMTPESLLYLAVVVATVAWSAYVWRSGLRAAFDRDTVFVDAAVAFAAALLCVQAVSPVFLGVDALAAGFVLFLFGLPALAVPRVLERIDLALDLIGTRGSVELKPWRVLLQQVGGLAFVLGAAVVFGALAFA